ncbi:MAG: hypothetical protein PWQ54_1676 [Bacteroidales bacterium]|nr:hypothetical protein [Bacteroidales bacterium]
MLSCLKATELIEKKSVFLLSPLEKAQLFMHTRVCDVCRNYQQQSELLDKVIQKELESINDEKLSINQESDNQRINRLKEKLDTEKFN